MTTTYHAKSQLEAEMITANTNLAVTVLNTSLEARFKGYAVWIYDGYVTVKSPKAGKKVEATTENIGKALDWIAKKATSNEDDFMSLAQWLCCLEGGGYDRD